MRIPTCNYAPEDDNAVKTLGGQKVVPSVPGQLPPFPSSHGERDSFQGPSSAVRSGSVAQMRPCAFPSRVHRSNAFVMRAARHSLAALQYYVGATACPVAASAGRPRWRMGSIAMNGGPRESVPPSRRRGSDPQALLGAPGRSGVDKEIVQARRELER